MHVNLIATILTRSRLWPKIEFSRLGIVGVVASYCSASNYGSNYDSNYDSNLLVSCLNLQERDTIVK